jgi:hypothetical protein
MQRGMIGPTRRPVSDICGGFAFAVAVETDHPSIQRETFDTIQPTADRLLSAIMSQKLPVGKRPKAGRNSIMTMRQKPDIDVKSAKSVEAYKGKSSIE